MIETLDYETFLQSKSFTANPCGIDVPVSELNDKLFDFQRDITRWALKRGRAAVFSQCGTGKTFVQAEWSNQVHKHTGVDVLILAPLAVSHQTILEAKKFGIDINLCESQDDVKPGVNITNYQKLHKLDSKHFGGVALDECFPAGTMVDTPSGEIDIASVQPGDVIYNASGIDTVIATKRRKLDCAVRIKTNTGETFISSKNHPFFTSRGYVFACELKPGDALVETSTAMRLVRGNDCSQNIAGCNEEILRSVLSLEMDIVRPKSQVIDSLPGNMEKDWRCAQVMVSLWGPESGGGNRSVQGAARREWARADISAIHNVFHTWRGVDVRASSLLLQDRHSALNAKNSCRGGRSCAFVKQGKGLSKGRIPYGARVASVEILKQGHHDLERYRDANGFIYFYDIQAARHPSFSIHGYLVHNSSILKSLTGATRTELIEAFARTPYRLACTATPAPNDFVELGNHAQFLGVMSHVEMLATFFVHDGGDTSKWRLKGHAEDAFWKWVAGWAVVLNSPSDLGYENKGFDLPELRMHEHILDMDQDAVFATGRLFPSQSLNLQEQRATKRVSIEDRVKVVADMANASNEPWLIWCDLNDEGDALAKAIPDAVQVAGADKDEFKEASLLGFAAGKIRVLVSKSKIAGFGMNFQVCNNMAFVGINHSFESVYQAIRRCWRFGQTKPVDCHMILMDSERAILGNLKRKELEAERMAEAMLIHMRDIQQEQIHGQVRQRDEFTHNTSIQLPNWI